MGDGILDYFGAFDEEVKVVAIKHFFLESEAHLYAARLKEAGIAHFLTNANTMTTLPLADQSIDLFVRETDLQAAMAVIARMDYQKSRPAAEQSFREADLEEIEYQRALHHAGKADRILFFILLVLVVLVLLRAVGRASGIFGAWADAF